MAHRHRRNPAHRRRWLPDMRIVENKTKEFDKTGVTCRVDTSSDEARRYGKTQVPGERNNPKLEIQHVGDRK